MPSLFCGDVFWGIFVLKNINEKNQGLYMFSRFVVWFTFVDSTAVVSHTEYLPVNFLALILCDVTHFKQPELSGVNSLWCYTVQTTCNFCILTEKLIGTLMVLNT